MTLADVRRDGGIVYLDIDEYADEQDAEDKSVKTADSIRLVPVHEKLEKLGFLDYVDAFAAMGHTHSFPT